MLALLPGMVWDTNRVDTPPRYAALVNAMVLPGESVWYAPAELHDWLYTNAPNATGRFYFVYPWLMDDPVIVSDLMKRLSDNPPVVVIYLKDAKAGEVEGWTLPRYASELTDWLDRNYTPAAEHDHLYRLNQQGLE